jgi:hypothetical protein
LRRRPGLNDQAKLEMLKKVNDTVEDAYRSGETQIFIREQR